MNIHRARLLWGPLAAVPAVASAYIDGHFWYYFIAIGALSLWALSLPLTWIIWSTRPKAYPDVKDRRAIRRLLLNREAIFTNSGLYSLLGDAKILPIIRSHRPEPGIGVSVVIDLPQRVPYSEAARASEPLASGLRLPFLVAVSVEQVLAHQARLTIVTRSALSDARAYEPRVEQNPG